MSLLGSPNKEAALVLVMEKRNQGYDRLVPATFELEDARESEEIHTPETTNYGTTVCERVPDEHKRKSQMALLMCFPYGILAYRNSKHVRQKAQQGDMEGARTSSTLALRYYRRSCNVFVLGGLVLLAVLGCSILFIALVMVIIYGSG